VHLQKNEREIACAVVDEGVGIEKIHLTKIFDRFYQARPGIKGTGIGLTIAKTWVEAHGGKIWAESEGESLPGEALQPNQMNKDVVRRRGTTVRFTLPL
jgi:signal transduction histidine kinase